MDRRISDEAIGKLAGFLDRKSDGAVSLYEMLSHLPEADKPKKKPKAKAKPKKKRR